MDEVVGVQGLSVAFEGKPVLEGLNLSFCGPGLFGILGPNGAGKTTLLNVLEGLSEPNSGHVRLFGQDLQKGPYPRHRVGVVLQKECTFEAIQVGEYAELFAAIYGVMGGAEQLMAKASLTDRSKQKVATLSGGEAQRLYIAAATVHSPDLVFLDEPTVHLDPQSKRELGLQLKEMAQARTVVMTTHDLKEAESLFDSVVFLVDGRVKASGTPDRLKLDGEGLEDAFFRHCALRIDSRGDAP